MIFYSMKFCAGKCVFYLGKPKSSAVFIICDMYILFVQYVYSSFLKSLISSVWVIHEHDSYFILSSSIYVSSIVYNLMTRPLLYSAVLLYLVHSICAVSCTYCILHTYVHIAVPVCESRQVIWHIKSKHLWHLPITNMLLNHLVPIGKMVSTTMVLKCHHHNYQIPFLFQCNYHIWQGQKMFLSSKMLRLVLGPKHPPIQWVPVALSLAVKWPEWALTLTCT